MKVAIAGYGIEGKSNYEYWSKLSAEITIFDNQKNPSMPLPEGVNTVLGADAFNKMQGYDIIVRTASLRPDKIKTDGKIWSSTNEFFTKCPAPIIGVTGTKGKGTTCSLIAEILKASGKNVHLLGNIGVPALDILSQIKSEDLVVFELSSFQLWDLEKSPHIAVVLMIEPDHMDVHASMEEYVEAKSHIAAFQSDKDVVIYHPTNKYSAQIAAKSPGQKIKYLSKEGAYIKDDQIFFNNQVICKTNEVGLIGTHNLENICAAITATWQYSNDIESLKNSITSFKGLPHRLEFVREVNGVKFYNDSYSSAPGATIAAIKSFSKPEIIICGGYDRGLDYAELANVVTSSSNIKKVFLIGETKQKIAQAFALAGFNNFELLINGDFTHFIHTARDNAVSGDVVILSPGCASFDMFKNFEDRGEQFKKIVREL